MTIIDPPIKDTSNFYLNELYLQQNSIISGGNVNDSSTTLAEKDTLHDQYGSNEIVVLHDEDDSLENYSIKNKISRKRKWFILMIVALQGFLGPLTSSIYVPAIAQVKESFHASTTAINATISLYVFTMGVAPLIWASFSERQGRRAIYLLATLLYLLTTIGCAVTSDIAVFILMRALQATGASAAQAVGAGTITDLFDMRERGSAMGLFLLGPLVGPVVGPIAGGFINEFFSWRYIFWFLSAMGALVFLLILFCLPETSATILRKRRLYKEKGRDYFDKTGIQESALKSIMRPFKFVAKPHVLLSTTPYSIAYGFMYFVIASLPFQLAKHYQFVSYQIGLSYLANGTGNAIGAFISGKMSDNALAKCKEEEKQTLELRLSPMWIGIILLPMGELMYGWCVEENVHVAASLVGLFLLGLGVGIVQTPSNTYIVDSYQKHSASVMSAANLLRCISAGCTPLIAPTLIDNIGNGWSMTILSVISFMSGICIFLVQRYGKKWRQHWAEN